ncbi:MAG TPA: hypothetical protein VGI30_01190 [Caulobacteraceae bacterium]
MTAIVLALAGCLAGCATSPASGPTDRERLFKSCADRGGFLVPIPGAHATNDAANFACELHGGRPHP